MSGALVYRKSQDFSPYNASGGRCFVTGLGKQPRDSGIFVGPDIPNDGVMEISEDAIRHAASEIGWRSPEAVTKLVDSYQERITELVDQVQGLQEESRQGFPGQILAKLNEVMEALGSLTGGQDDLLSSCDAITKLVSNLAPVGKSETPRVSDAKADHSTAAAKAAPPKASVK